MTADIIRRIDTLVFDLDGTLYDDIRIYNRHARELVHFVPPKSRRAFLRDWRAARDADSWLRVGLGYDESLDRLFEFEGSTILRYLDWSGTAIPQMDASPVLAWGSRGASDEADQRFFHLGDLWGLLTALATHYGIERQERHAAFLATREAMVGDEFLLRPDPRLAGILSHLKAEGKHLLAMSNSPESAVLGTLRELKLGELFEQVLFSAAKPRGLVAWMAEANRPGNVLSAGDHFINDIEPALAAGAEALYIDRHATGLGRADPHCHTVGSRAQMRTWLRRTFL